MFLSFYFSILFGPVAADCAATFFYLCKDDQSNQQHQAKRPTLKVSIKPAKSGSKGGKRGQVQHKTGNLQHRHCNTGVFLGTKTTIFFVRYILDMWTKQNKRKQKTTKKTTKKLKKRKTNKWRESIYLYFCTEETHGTKTLLVLCLHANKMSGIMLTVFLSSVQISSSWDSDWEKRRTFFLYIKKVFCFFFSLFFFFSTIHSTHLGSTESLWKR